MADRPVLYCYDGSTNAKRALEVGSELLARRSAVVLTVWQSALRQLLAVPYAPLSAAAIDETDAAIKERYQGICDEGRDLIATSHTSVEERLEESLANPWKTLIDVADDLDAAVIVAGSRGLGAISAGILGSVSHALANHSHRPVLIIPPEDEDD